MCPPRTGEGKGNGNGKDLIRDIFSAKGLFPRNKEPHYPAYNSYPYDNAGDHRKHDSKIKGQLEDQKKERDQYCAE
jgi:hypothetical protein